MPDNRDFLTLAHEMADAAAEAIRPHFRRQIDVQIKPDKSPVTIADRAAEEAMRSIIIARFPDHGILGEEDESIGTDREYVWVLDPIDGTRAFLAGKYEWGTLIGLCHRGEPIVGIMHQPITNERWMSVKGGKTLYDGKQTAVRACARLSDAVISTTSYNHFRPVQAKAFVTLAESCQRPEKDGDCYAYGMLARGERDIVADAGLKPYDIVPLRPIVEGAGGKMTSWNGKPITLSNFETVIATGDARTHEAALKVLAVAAA